MIEVIETSYLRAKKVSKYFIDRGFVVSIVLLNEKYHISIKRYS